MRKFGNELPDYTVSHFGRVIVARTSDLTVFLTAVPTEYPCSVLCLRFVTKRYRR